MVGLSSWVEACKGPKGREVKHRLRFINRCSISFTWISGPTKLHLIQEERIKKLILFGKLAIFFPNIVCRFLLINNRYIIASYFAMWRPWRVWRHIRVICIITPSRPFSLNFTKGVKTMFLKDYVLNKERLRRVLPYQMEQFCEDELNQKYKSYFPTRINSLDDLLKVLREVLYFK